MEGSSSREGHTYIHRYTDHDEPCAHVSCNCALMSILSRGSKTLSQLCFSREHLKTFDVLRKGLLLGWGITLDALARGLILEETF